jgi:hypothetical protein
MLDASGEGESETKKRLAGWLSLATSNKLNNTNEEKPRVGTC